MKKPKKQVKLGMAVAAKAGKNPAFGKKLNSLPHGSAARTKLAKGK